MTFEEYQKILNRIDQLAAKARKTKLSQNEANELKQLLEEAEKYESQDESWYHCAVED